MKTVQCWIFEEFPLLSKILGVQIFWKLHEAMRIPAAKHFESAEPRFPINCLKMTIIDANQL